MEHVLEMMRQSIIKRMGAHGAKVAIGLGVTSFPHTNATFSSGYTGVGDKKTQIHRDGQSSRST